MLEILAWALLKFLLIAFAFVLGMAAVLTVVERKQSAAVQNRIGPNRAQLWGGRFLPSVSAFVGQIIADAVKVFVKEDFDPAHGSPWLHRISPSLALIPALVVWAVIPFGPGPMPGATGPHYFQVANLEVGILFYFAVISLAVYGPTMAAWASNSAFSLLGGLRAAAQMVSYEITLGLNLVGIFMIFGSLSLNDIIWGQGALLWGWLPEWGIVVQPLGFLLFITAATAETCRAPFDLTEAESELVAGFQTEFSGMRFAVFNLSEFVGIVAVAAIGACLFLGGWQIPWVETPVDSSGLPVLGWLTLAQVAVFLCKVIFLVWLQMQVRWTLPRFRYDQVMRLGWVYLLPLSIANLAVTAIVLYVIR